MTNLLWHYADGAALKSIIENHVFWASSPAFMNDLDELLSGSRMLQNLFRREREKLEDEEKAKLEQLIGGDGLRADRFILSACADGDSLTMWRAYGRAAVSYAVGVDADVPLYPRAQTVAESHPNPSESYYSEWMEEGPEGEPIQTHNPDYVYIEGTEWQEVIYDEDSQAKMVLDVFERLKASVRSEIESKARGESRIFLYQWFALDELYHIKDRGFRDERESRILMLINPFWKFVLYRPGPFGLVPYVEIGAPLDGQFGVDGRQEMEHLPIREIRIGPTPYRKEAIASLQRFLDLHGYHEVEVNASEIPFRS